MSSCKTAETNEMAGLLGLEAPRYTSYPSAHHFSPQVNPETYAAWLANIHKNATISAYVHIPFCKELCWFCGCHTKMTKRYEPIAKYVRVLLQEIELIGKMAGGKGKPRPSTTICSGFGMFSDDRARAAGAMLAHASAMTQQTERYRDFN